MKWYNKAVIYNKTAYFIIDFCFIKPNFYRKTPLFFCKNQKNILFRIYLILNVKQSDGIDVWGKRLCQKLLWLEVF